MVEALPKTFYGADEGGLSLQHTRAELQERECRRLLEGLREMRLVAPARCYARDDIIFLEGEYGDALYILTSGVVKLSRNYSGGKEATLRLLSPWDIFGDLAPGAQISQQTSARAFTSCEVVKVPKVFVERVARSRPDITSSLLTLMGLELAQQRELAGCLLPYKTETRLASLMQILLQKFGADDEPATIGLRLTRTELAAMIASTRESVTGVLIGWKERGVLEIKNGHITVLKPAELAEISCGREL